MVQNGENLVWLALGRAGHVSTPDGGLRLVLGDVAKRGGVGFQLAAVAAMPG